MDNLVSNSINGFNLLISNYLNASSSYTKVIKNETNRKCYAIISVRVYYWETTLVLPIITVDGETVDADKKHTNNYYYTASYICELKPTSSINISWSGKTNLNIAIAYTISKPLTVGVTNNLNGKTSILNTTTNKNALAIGLGSNVYDSTYTVTCDDVKQANNMSFGAFGFCTIFSTKTKTVNVTIKGMDSSAFLYEF